MVLCIIFMIIIFSESEIWLVQRSGPQDPANSTLLLWLTVWGMQVGYLVSLICNLGMVTAMLARIQKGILKLQQQFPLKTLIYGLLLQWFFLSASISTNLIFHFKRHSFLRINAVNYECCKMYIVVFCGHLRKKCSLGDLKFHIDTILSNTLNYYKSYFHCNLYIQIQLKLSKLWAACQSKCIALIWNTSGM